MNRMWAIVERELRKFFRSPALMLVSMVFPLVQLIVLGIMGEYLGRIFDEVKNRPHFVIDSTAGWVATSENGQR